MINSAINLRHLLYRSAAIALVAAATGCTNFRSDVENDLDAAMAQWEANGYASYSMHYEHVGFAGNLAAKVHIEAGSVVAFEDVTVYGDTVSDSLLVVWNIEISSFHSIEGLFGIIEAAVGEQADEIAVTYHADLGYPETIYIDYIKLAIDDERSFYASDVMEKL